MVHTPSRLVLLLRFVNKSVFNKSRAVNRLDNCLESEMITEPIQVTGNRSIPTIYVDNRTYYETVIG